MHRTGTLFLTLRVFSATGGIEKVCRVAGKALYELANEKKDEKLQIFSLYDEPGDVSPTYFNPSVFCGFGLSKARFLYACLKNGLNSRMVILSHVNLLIIGYFIRVFSPKTQLVLVAHGIEVWRSFPKWKKRMLHTCDKILPVSEYTKEKMMALYGIEESKFTTLNNCLDPFLPLPLQQNKDAALQARYGIQPADKVLLTLTRIASGERYKGYDMVLQAIHDLKKNYPAIKYLIAGKYDAVEKARLDGIIARLGIQSQVIFTGFIPDAGLAALFTLADVYIMPSRKEGFGIVFIEAMFYGKPVIAGNIDGSVDALQNGFFGLLVNPNDQKQVNNAVVEVLNDTVKFVPRQVDVLRFFSFEVYKEKLRAILFAG